MQKFVWSISREPVCPTWMICGMWVGLRPKVRMVTLMEVKGHQRSNGVSYVLWLPYLVKRSPDASWEMMMTLMEVKGHQRSNGVNYVLWLPYLVKSPDASWEWYDDLDGGQRSPEVKWGKLCAMATIFGQKKPWCKLRMMMTLMEVKGHQRSNGVNYVLWLPYLVKRSADASWEWWWPWWRSKVTRGQMGKTMCYWLPYLVKRSADASGEWWWSLRRSKVIRGQMW